MRPCQQRHLDDLTGPRKHILGGFLAARCGKKRSVQSAGVRWFSSTVTCRQARQRRLSQAPSIAACLPHS